MQLTTSNEMGVIAAPVIPKRAKWQQYYNIVKELAIVEFRKKYHDSTLGYFWSMLNPLLRFGVYHFVFSYLFIVKVPKFTLYLLLGVFLWNFFQDVTSSAINAVRSRAKLTKTIYFPRYLIVFSSSLTALFSFIINTILLTIIVIVFDHAAILQIAALIPFILLVLLSTGVGLLLAILFVHFRDITEIWNVVLTLGFFLTPIMYDPHNVPAPLAMVALLNPVGRVLVMFRAYMLFDNLPTWAFSISTTVVCIGIFVLGIWLFMKYEHRIPEYV